MKKKKSSLLLSKKVIYTENYILYMFVHEIWGSEQVLFIFFFLFIFYRPEKKILIYVVDSFFVCSLLFKKLLSFKLHYSQSNFRRFKKSLIYLCYFIHSSSIFY